ncbi:DNA excision repair protein ERCC-5 [Fonsecaea pedrosoi]|nr:DNA excision repair protein ERCC-5 [Fonsecaea pedrosoi]
MLPCQQMNSKGEETTTASTASTTPRPRESSDERIGGKRPRLKLLKCEDNLWLRRWASLAYGKQYCCLEEPRGQSIEKGNQKKPQHHEQNPMLTLTCLPFYDSLLKEIGKGERVALSRLSIEHLQKQSRPLRIAIDAAIWNFQTQHGGQGGKNPALRTLFYRLVKLLALPVQPVFVYDGKNKPLTKRGRTVSKWHGGCVESEMSKGLVSLFRYPTHVAPGEAEAECAMLQRKGIVDAVMTQDVDAIMFGSGLTLRDWSKEGNGKKGNKTATHVSVLDLHRVKKLSGLDPEGMILVALLSGGDYDEDGVAGIGSTLACEIARAGFGSDLLDLVRSGDENGITEWRERLQFELETNESGYFKMKRKSIRIPDNFPDRKILGYYMNPAVTPADELKRLEKSWVKAWDGEIDMQALRVYAAEMFDWMYKPGAWKFVRVMAPALLADRLQRGAAASHITSSDQITERRQHFVSDGIPELRVTVIPGEVVGLDLAAEKDSPEYLQLLAEEENEGLEGEPENAGTDGNAPLSPSKKRKSPPWLPHAPEKMWIAQTIVEIGAREHVRRWEQIQFEINNDPKKFAARKCAKQKEKKSKTTGGMQPGALLNYVVTAKEAAVPEVYPAKSISSPRPRPKANVSEPRRSKSTKSKSSQMNDGQSPTIFEHLKSTKSRHDFHETASARDSVSFDTVRTGIGSGDDPFILSEQTCSGKHSRPSTSSSTKTGRRIVHKSSPLYGNMIHPMLHDTRPPVLSQREKRSEKVFAKVTSGEDLSRNAIEEESLPFSSPVRGKSNSAVDHGETQEALDSLSNITRRTPRKRANKYRALTEVGGSSESLVEPQRRIVSFFRPYVREKAPPSQAAPVEGESRPVEVLPKLTSEKSANPSSAMHIHAIPRSSLPGTWKEVECESGSSTQIYPSLASPRRARLSIIDLTSD